MTDRERLESRIDSKRVIAVLVVAAAVAELWMAWYWFGFLTGDDVEVLAEAFRVAIGFSVSGVGHPESLRS